MSNAWSLSRSPELMSPADTALLVVDVQTKLIGLIPDHLRIVWNIGRLIDGAHILDLPVAATEQYPQGLGPTTAELADGLEDIHSKMTFSCASCVEIFEKLSRRGVHKILVAGIEAHVCVQQTVLDLLAGGFRVYIPVDGVGARHEIDRDTALRRMDSAGATLTSTEAALFEWCVVSGTPEFKQISALVRQSPPVE